MMKKVIFSSFSKYTAYFFIKYDYISNHEYVFVEYDWRKGKYAHTWTQVWTIPKSLSLEMFFFILNFLHFRTKWSHLSDRLNGGFSPTSIVRLKKNILFLSFYTFPNCMASRGNYSVIRIGDILPVGPSEGVIIE